MIRYSFLFYLLVTSASGLRAQDSRAFGSRNTGKPVLDTSLFDKWQSVDDAAISNDGKYALYKIDQRPVGGTTLVVQALGDDWKEECPGAGSVLFTEDSRRVIFIAPGDSLCVLTLGSSTKKWTTHVGSFDLMKQGKVEWLVCRLNTPDKTLLVRDLGTGKETSFAGVDSYFLGKRKDVLLLKTGSYGENRINQSLQWVTPVDGSSRTIWRGYNADNFVLDNVASQLAFRVTDMTAGETRKSIWLYKVDADAAEELATDQSEGMDSTLQTEGVSNFSKDGSRLFINLVKRDPLKPKVPGVSVDIWSYTDAKVQSQQLLEVNDKEVFKAVVEIKDHHIFCFQHSGNAVSMGGDSTNDKFVLVDDRKGAGDDRYWSRASKLSNYVVSTITGECVALNLLGPMMSPGGQYVVSFVGDELHQEKYACFNIATRQVYDISEAIPVPYFTDENNLRSTKGILFGAWMSGPESSLLVYDKYDIWKIDPAGKEPPVNITNGYGRKNNLVFQLANATDYQNYGKTSVAVGELLLKAFNVVNKDEGFYAIFLGGKADPHKLTMGPYDYAGGFPGPRSFIKARDADVYLVMRCSATQSPNYFWTKDFKLFVPVSSVYPEKNYNWLTSELVTFRTLDGVENQGVIYKPENFDPARKYPVIFQYYQLKSQQLNEYRPLYADDNFSFSWFASHGYVIFTPDIHYKMGHNGLCAYNSLMGAVKYLETLPWVDVKHMGIEGHSFGGSETDYLVTHSSSFAAAISSSGVSDAFDEYGSVWGFGNASGASKEGYVEKVIRMGATPWERPDLYAENSPIFKADKITTPMLLVSDLKDGSVRFEQGLALFLALRRLGKPGWMLQYDGEGHGLGGKAFVDFTLRAQQFFDYYLKGSPAPKWMVEGIPAKMKRIDSGLKLEPTGKGPGPGLLERAAF